MRWNRMITSVCIFLLELCRIGIVIIGVVVAIAFTFNKFEAPFALHLDDSYQFENQEMFYPIVTYKGQSYSGVSVAPKTHFIILEELPISKYWTIISLAVIVGSIYFFLQLLIGLLKSIEEKEFFSIANVKRLRAIGLLIIGFSIVKWIYSMIVSYFLTSALQIEGLYKVSSGFILNMGFFKSLAFLGLMVLLVANAFEHGVRLKEEQELTI